MAGSLQDFSMLRIRIFARYSKYNRKRNEHIENRTLYLQFTNRLAYPARCAMSLSICSTFNSLISLKIVDLDFDFLIKLFFQKKYSKNRKLDLKWGFLSEKGMKFC
jgi:hypothetical protein